MSGSSAVLLEQDQEIRWTYTFGQPLTTACMSPYSQAREFSQSLTSSNKDSASTSNAANKIYMGNLIILLLPVLQKNGSHEMVTKIVSHTFTIVLSLMLIAFNK